MWTASLDLRVPIVREHHQMARSRGGSRVGRVAVCNDFATLVPVCRGRLALLQHGKEDVVVHVRA